MSENDNIFPEPTSDREAFKQIMDHFLGKDWYVVDPLSHDQVNTIAVTEIIRKCPKQVSMLMLSVKNNEAFKKQKPMKPTHEASLQKCFTCPRCKNVIDKFEQFGESEVRVKYNYCHFCGQKLDWD